MQNVVGLKFIWDKITTFCLCLTWVGEIVFADHFLQSYLKTLGLVFASFDQEKIK